MHLRSREGEEQLHDRRRGGHPHRKQKFKANKKTSNPACPKEGTLTGDWTVTSGWRNRQLRTDPLASTQQGSSDSRSNEQMNGGRPVRDFGPASSSRQDNRGCIRTWHAAQSRQGANGAQRARPGSLAAPGASCSRIALPVAVRRQRWPSAAPASAASSPWELTSLHAPSERAAEAERQPGDDDQLPRQRRQIPARIRKRTDRRRRRNQVPAIRRQRQGSPARRSKS